MKQFYVSRGRNGYISAEDGAQYLRKIRVNAGAKKTGRMIEAADFEEAMARGEEALPILAVPIYPKAERAPSEEGVGRYYLMKADAEHDNVDWVGQYCGSGLYRDQHDNKTCPRPVAARHYEVKKTWIKVELP